MIDSRCHLSAASVARAVVPFTKVTRLSRGMSSLRRADVHLLCVRPPAAAAAALHGVKLDYAGLQTQARSVWRRLIVPVFIDILTLGYITHRNRVVDDSRRPSGIRRNCRTSSTDEHDMQ